VSRALLCAALLAASAATAKSAQWAKSKGVVFIIVEGPFDDVRGESKKISGALEIDPDAWANGKGSVAVELDSLRTGIDQRDEDMRVEFLQTTRFPYAVLTIEKLERPSTPALANGANVKADVSGTFEIHGVRRRLSFPLNLHREENGDVRALGQFDVPFADYNISRPSRLFLKLGDTAHVVFDVTFHEVPEAAPLPKPVEPTVAQVLPAAPKPKPPPKKKPKPALVFSSLFTSGDAKSRGEKLFHSEAAGGPGNKMTCFHCHAYSEDAQLKDGHVRAGRTLLNASQRTKFWNGFAEDPAKASAICQKAFMEGAGFSKEQEEDLLAFLDAISPQKTPELDYAVNYSSMETLLQDPTGGNAANGKKLAEKYCMTCHLDGRVGPVWAPGLYEPDWVVRRVRRLEGHANHQMPAFSQARLPDSDLRDIVTYLTSPQSAPPIFKRKKSAGAPAPKTAGGQR
jgi:polyisoprenoid-binding protein YceI/mono/diheme cytochrome c family protein